MNGNPGARGPARRASGISRIAALGLASWLGAAATIASAADAEGGAAPPEPSTVEGNVAGESTFIEPPPFPGPDIGDAFRFQAETFAAPDASIGSGHVSVVRPELGVRVTWPVSDRLVLRLVSRVAESRYRFRGDVWGATVAHPLGPFPDADQLVGDRLDLHAARVSFEGAYRLSDNTRWFADTEQWAVLGTANIGSRWEDGDFDTGLAAGGALGLGYEIPKRLRVALGVSLQTPLDQADLELSPFFSLRWRPIERLTVRTRELGLQVEVDLAPSLEVYLTGFRSSDGYRLRDRFHPLGDLSFSDRQLRLGAGLDWSIKDWLRLGLEAGAIADRRVRVREEDLGTLLSRRADPSAYFEVRFELRL